MKWEECLERIFWSSRKECLAPDAVVFVVVDDEFDGDVDEGGVNHEWIVKKVQVKDENGVKR